MIYRREPRIRCRRFDQILRVKLMTLVLPGCSFHQQLLYFFFFHGGNEHLSSALSPEMSRCALGFVANASNWSFSPLHPPSLPIFLLSCPSSTPPPFFSVLGGVATEHE